MLNQEVGFQMSDKDNKKSTKTPIKMRFKTISEGYRSIYLDCYKDGQRSYEYLKLYLVPETDQVTKRKNEATMRKAESILKQRLREQNKQPVISKRLQSTSEDSSKSEITLSEWLLRFKSIQISRGVRHTVCVNKLIKIISEMNCSDMLLKDVDKHFCISFIEHLHSMRSKDKGLPIKPKTAYNHQSTLVTALNFAVREGVIPFNPMDRLSRYERIKQNRGKREYLTIGEVKSLIETPCNKEIVKQAYLFACNCGLRLGDVRKLKWGDITTQSEKWILSITMNKSEKPIHIPLGTQAKRWMPMHPDQSAGQLVFEGLPSGDEINKNLKIWAERAGVCKTVTFHTSRHTFATTLLTLGADLYTVSKLLGHSQIKNTQIYAEIINSRKDEAVNLADTIFNEP